MEDLTSTIRVCKACKKRFVTKGYLFASDPSKIICLDCCAEIVMKNISIKEHIKNMEK